MNLKSVTSGLLTVALLAACSRSPNETNVATSAAASMVSAAAVAAVPIPVKEDFEAAAKQAISSSNLDDQVAELEKQIGTTK